MDVYSDPARLRSFREAVAAIGNFDGVHVGHRELFRVAVTSARGRDGESLVLTFEPHPVRVLAPALAPPLLTSLERKLELIEATGIDACLVHPFTDELAGQSADRFVDEVLVRALGVREVVVGHDFTYGKGRQGNVDTLAAAGAARGFVVHVVPPVTVAGLVASSTKIREFVLSGNIAGASLLLGRPHEVEGQVVRGAGRGRTIGVPTANVAVDSELLPRPGVYAARLTLLDGRRPVWTRGAAVNLGTSPTFVDNGRLALEAHILDWDGDLYQRRVRVGFEARLRGEERFASADALVAQIRQDIESSRKILETQ